MTSSVDNDDVETECKEDEVTNSEILTGNVSPRDGGNERSPKNNIFDYSKTFQSFGGSYGIAQNCDFLFDNSCEQKTSTNFKMRESIEEQCPNEDIVLTTESTANTNLRGGLVAKEQQMNP